MPNGCIVDGYSNFIVTISLKFQRGGRPPKDNKPDEELNPRQIELRYSYCNERVRKTLSMMDFEKIDYDLIETTLIYIVEKFPAEGSILVFLPGLQEIMTAFDQVTIHVLYPIQFSLTKFFYKLNLFI